MNQLSISEALQRAIDFQRRGQLDVAADIYRRILAVDSNQPDALHLLGLIESSQGNHASAIALIQRAVQIMPTSDTFWSNLGVTLKTAGQIQAAIDAYQRALDLNPSNADAHFNIGKSFKAAGMMEQAETAFRRALELDRTRSSPWLSLMSLYTEVHHLGEASSLAEEAERLFPSNSEILLNVGAIRKRAGDLEQALATYKKVLEFAPEHVDALCRSASACFAMYRMDEGLSLLERARRLDSQSEHVHSCFGTYFNTIGNATEAVSAFRLATIAKPNHGTAYCNLGAALRKLGDLSDALASADRSIELEGRNAEFLAVRGGIRLCVGMHRESEADYRKAVELRQGHYKDAHQSLMMCLQYRPGISPRDLLEVHQGWADRFAASVAKSPPPYRCGIDSRPIRIGFVSPDMGAHPVGYFSTRLLESIDRSRFKTYVYSDRLGEDWLKERLRTKVDCWRDTIALSDDHLAKQVAEDEIDVLFDLTGHTSQNRLLLFARRVAPLQITWAGYVGTTGIPEMDGLIADRFQIAEGTESFYTERILRMPDDYVTYFPPLDTPAVDRLPAIGNGYVTFGAMCNPAKVNDDVLQLWGEILSSLPSSRMLLCYNGWPDRMNRERVERVMRELGCENRVDFEQTTGATALMGRYNRVDIALDTFPYSGGLTTIEAMWMGVPTITWPGQTFAGRHSLTHLSNVGLSDWVVSSREGYKEKAMEMASDLERLSGLRVSLRERVLSSPLSDGPRFARAFEQIVLAQLQSSPWIRS